MLAQKQCAHNKSRKNPRTTCCQRVARRWAGPIGVRPQNRYAHATRAPDGCPRPESSTVTRDGPDTESRMFYALPCPKLSRLCVKSGKRSFKRTGAAYVSALAALVRSLSALGDLKASTRDGGGSCPRTATSYEASWRLVGWLRVKELEFRISTISARPGGRRPEHLQEATWGAKGPRCPLRSGHT